MCTLKWFVLTAVAAIVAYSVLKPMPVCFDNLPSNVRLMFQLFPMARHIGNLLESLGIASYTQVLRAVFMIASMKESDTDSLQTVDSVFDGVPVRVYFPTQLKPNGPALLYIHGGGWTIGTIDSTDKLVRVFAEQLNLVAVNVEYRLAPESTYPAALDDVERTFRYLVKHAGDYDIDPSRIAVAGDSAGGNLAAALTVRLRDSAAISKEQTVTEGKAKATSQVEKSQVQPKLQILLYPFLQAINVSTVSILQFDDDFVLRRSDLISMTLLYAMGNDYYNKTLRSLSEQYLEQACYRSKYPHVDHVYLDKEKRDIRQRIVSDSDRAFLSTFSKEARGRQLLKPTCEIKDKTTLDELDSRLGRILNADFSPLLSESVEALPTAYIVTCGYDVIRDDGLLYVERLRDAGVRVEHNHQPDECHGFYAFKPESSIVGLRELLAKTDLL